MDDAFVRYMNGLFYIFFHSFWREKSRHIWCFFLPARSRALSLSGCTLVGIFQGFKIVCPSFIFVSNPTVETGFDVTSSVSAIKLYPILIWHR